MASSQTYYCPYQPQDGGACIRTQPCTQDSDCPADSKCQEAAYWNSWQDCAYGYDPQQRTGDCGGGLQNVNKNQVMIAASPSAPGPSPNLPAGSMKMCVYNAF